MEIQTLACYSNTAVGLTHGVTLKLKLGDRDCEMWGVPFMYGEKVSYKKIQNYKNYRVYTIEDQDIPWVRQVGKKRKKVYEHGYHSEPD